MVENTFPTSVHHSEATTARIDLKMSPSFSATQFISRTMFQIIVEKTVTLWPIPHGIALIIMLIIKLFYYLRRKGGIKSEKKIY